MRHKRWMVFFTIAMVTYAQQVGENKQSGDTPTFSITRQLKIEQVLVKDKNGNPVEGLTAKDFTVTEDGVAQSIRHCEFQNVLDTAAPPPVNAVSVSMAGS